MTKIELKNTLRVLSTRVLEMLQIGDINNESFFCDVRTLSEFLKDYLDQIEEQKDQKNNSE